MASEPIVTFTSKIFAPEPVTWAGRGYLTHKLCMGTDKGRLFWADLDQGVQAESSGVLGSGEAINGAVFTDEICVVTNRSEVVIAERTSWSLPVVREGGAHGVIASEAGRILAPRGSEGLLIIPSPDDGPPIPKDWNSGRANPYFYQTIQIGRLEQGREWFASACRDDGVAVFPIHLGGEVGEFQVVSRKTPRTREDADFVSLCSLDQPGHPYALALLAMDGTIYFTADAREVGFTEMALDNLGGTPYSIHSAQGNLFILTSEKLYMMNDFADRAVRDPQSFSRDRLKSVSIGVDAVDCSIVDNEYLLLVHDHYLTVNRVSELAQGFRQTKDSVNSGMGGSTEVFPIDPEFLEIISEPQAVQPSDLVATVLGAA